MYKTVIIKEVKKPRMLRGTCLQKKIIMFRMLLKVPKNLNMCPDVSGLCPSSVECSL